MHNLQTYWWIKSFQRFFEKYNTELCKTNLWQGLRFRLGELHCLPFQAVITETELVVNLSALIVTLPGGNVFQGIIFTCSTCCLSLFKVNWQISLMGFSTTSCNPSQGFLAAVSIHNQPVPLSCVLLVLELYTTATEFKKSVCSSKILLVASKTKFRKKIW